MVNLQRDSLEDIGLVIGATGAGILVGEELTDTLKPLGKPFLIGGAGLTLWSWTREEE